MSARARTLHLHLGHFKTGSSHLQSAFRGSVARLAEAGVAYPLQPLEQAAGPERILSGNAVLAFREAEGLAERLAAAAGPATGSALFSSEFLPRWILGWPDPRLLREAAASAGFDRVEALMFVRAPVATAISIWQQKIKRERLDADVAAWFESFDLPEEAAAALRALDAAGVAVTLRSYDACRGRLVEVVEDWLGVPEGTLQSPAGGPVNRSLSAAELALMRALNRHIPRDALPVADALCERLPNVAPDAPAPPEAVQRAMIARLRPALDALSARLPEGEALADDVRPERAPEARALSAEQCGVIAEALAGALATRDAAIAAQREEIGALKWRLAAPARAHRWPVLAKAALRGLADELRGRGRPPAGTVEGGGA